MLKEYLSILLLKLFNIRDGVGGLREGEQQVGNVRNQFLADVALCCFLEHNNNISLLSNVYEKISRHNYIGLL